ncbi:hypothetical protein LR48_Vigan11g031000 [Vigna angularis]|uniref:Uncharacterized protein n=1 Tax=Phaseolus angularis TaxID=3914 RepID=A0A0L9VQP6_PHAAN|nr:hypothetical protein LR48_Vigan11g031000 [Vigna angularis]
MSMGHLCSSSTCNECRKKFRSVSSRRDEGWNKKDASLICHYGEKFVLRTVKTSETTTAVVEVAPAGHQWRNSEGRRYGQERRRVVECATTSKTEAGETTGSTRVAQRAKEWHMWTNPQRKTKLHRGRRRFTQRKKKLCDANGSFAGFENMKWSYYLGYSNT